MCVYGNNQEMSFYGFKKRKEKMKCSLCKDEIKERTRVVVNVRHLGRMRVLDNLHESCWNKLIEKHVSEQASLKEDPYRCPTCGGG
jgi:predicted RNA-binding Zn-ribbon protein involved in translation (DUF1610 family)